MISVRGGMWEAKAAVCGEIAVLKLSRRNGGGRVLSEGELEKARSCPFMLDMLVLLMSVTGS